ncbi:hypothetical protein [Escherichia coli]|uniref:hypothetical protein n=1 Tax=Escherichia coli TaxID=562 RepID=UPI0016A437E8|nr:hypothetical protein [Escherichia coli]EFH2540558.1 hypothetical protein [Escherichia coli]EFI5593550.1 hypothetical protein [Escherichia coli]EFI6094938.1 hypothetical protein [Escherichia coli]EFI8984812.1 hypothetical protein [Escherichia coli]EFI9568654.1 hypothetical protein [Escherichia coli]
MSKKLCLSTLFCVSLISFSAVSAGNNTDKYTGDYLQKLSGVQPDIASVASDVVNAKKQHCNTSVTVEEIKRIISQDESFHQLLEIKSAGHGGNKHYQKVLENMWKECERQ